MTAANWARLIGHSGNSTEHYGVAGGYCFPVTCNGNGHTIKIKISDVNDNYQGLFYGIGKEATVKNLHVVADIHCAKSRLVGGIAGENNGTISNCWVSGNVSSDWKNSSVAARQRQQRLEKLQRGSHGQGGRHRWREQRHDSVLLRDGQRTERRCRRGRTGRLQ